MTRAILLTLSLCACTDTRSPDQRRESMVKDCIVAGSNPIDCANAAEIAIPRRQVRP